MKKLVKIADRDGAKLSASLLCIGDQLIQVCSGPVALMVAYPGDLLSLRYTGTVGHSNYTCLGQHGGIDNVGSIGKMTNNFPSQSPSEGYWTLRVNITPL